MKNTPFFWYLLFSFAVTAAGLFAPFVIPNILRQHFGELIWQGWWLGFSMYSLWSLVWLAMLAGGLLIFRWKALSLLPEAPIVALWTFFLVSCGSSYSGCL